MAWLNATPVTKKGKPIKPHRPRGEKDYGGERPTAGAFEYLVTCLWEIGQSTPTGNGFAPLTWQEIKAWSELRGLDFEYWELQIIHDMSIAYVSMYAAAQDTECKWPRWVLENIKNKARKKQAG